ncbi:MAG TPA: hypothetical protein VGK24_11240 [Candidatus Angelobacter sp.]
MKNEPKKEVPAGDQAQTAPAATPKAEKVRSSRYEWEGKSNESGVSAGTSSAPRRSLFSSMKAMFKRFFSGNRGAGDRGFFDNDDDASPSAA